MTTVRTKQFKKESKKALKNSARRNLVRKAVDTSVAARDETIKEITTEAWEKRRQRARAIKVEAIKHLDYYLELLDRQVRRHGGSVHFAQTAEEANRKILEIAKARNVKSIVKTKSMVTEELGLTPYLNRRGIKTVETDLGEFIIQLAGESPFHMISPALHKSRQEVSDLFRRHLKSESSRDIGDLVDTARVSLRDNFVEADMGITGANFLVAETGTVVLVSNEGNGRMSTTLPKTVVTVAGIEKVIPALEDLSAFTELLTVSATGQLATSYMTLFGGPRGPSEEDGPEEFHLVLVDNGRVKFLEDPDLKEALYCIKCGACSNVCPVYRNVGGHAYGGVYSGPIGSVITPVMVGVKNSKMLPFASTLCGACRDVCPVKIDIPKMLVNLRRRATEGHRSERSSNLFEHFPKRVWFRALRTKQSFERNLRWLRRLLSPWARNGIIRRAPIPMIRAWTRGRDFPGIPNQSFREIWETRLKKEDTGRL